MSSTSIEAKKRKRDKALDMDPKRPKVESHGSTMEDLLKAPITIKVRSYLVSPHPETQ